ncbi:nuclear transport factor 2 family protein [Saccharothrix longispora]|uniref:Ketosteroid isomerase-like protein n=1 Tax=Saccharothrix longispora TaxID=33920 RepID=A0ABU1PNI4_9PSEU|nr:nuclear transport factor 2 family protein [Saccharothrix longispora]MDR6592188.1 ketosteroid isomerase-like protein [Saccharothrix longispora]
MGGVTAAVERLVARWAAGDAAGTARLFAPEVRWWAAPVPGAPWPARVRSLREVEAFFLGFLGAFELTGITTRALVVDGVDAVLTGQLHARLHVSDESRSFDFALSVSVRHDLISEFRLYADTLALASALAAPGVPPVSPQWPHGSVPG